MPADAETSVTRNIPKFYSDCSPIMYRIWCYFRPFRTHLYSC